MNTKIVIIAVLVILVIAAGSQSLFTIDEKEQGIILQMGQYLKTIKEPGLHFKMPFFQTVYRFEDRVLYSDSPVQEFLTLDKKRLVVDCYTRWRITDPLSFYKTVKTEAGATARLDDIVFSELRKELSANNFDAIISEQREPIMETVAQRAGELVTDFGVEIIDVRMKRADLPEEVQASVYARMQAERERIAKRYRAEGDEEAKTIMGSAEAEAIEILAEAFEQDPEFYAFLRTLEAYEEFIMGAGGTTLVLSTDSALFKYLEGPQPQ